MKESIYLGIDIGGSALKYGWGNCKQGLLSFDRIELNGNSLQSLQSSIHYLLKSVDTAVGLSNIEAIGVGVPGTLELKTGRIVGINPNLPQLTEFDPKSLFPEEFISRVHVENDANLMALAEADQLQDCKYVIGITIGSGIGCGFVKNGQIYHGAHGYAMEFGHTIIKEKGAKCNCGRYGCLEAYTSVNGLLNLIHAILPDLKPKTMQDIISLAKKDAAIKKILLDSIEHLSVGIANLAVILDADAIIIGGGVVDVPDYPFSILQKKSLDLIPEQLKNQLMIKRAVYGNKAGVIGAIIIAGNDKKSRHKE
jgi:glucokinase